MVENGRQFNMGDKINERLNSVMDHAKRIEADTADERRVKLKDRAIQISFNAGELDRLKEKAAANGLNLQDYIRKILSTYG
jgi:predicted DNA binding CopG/RHH family protein